MEEAIHKIQLYLAGEMPEEEKLLFESQLAQDINLKHLFTSYQSIENMMSEKNENGETQLKSTLDELSKKYFSPGRPGRILKLSRRFIAAAAMIVITLALLFIFNQKDDEQDLYATYAKHEPLLVQERSNAEDSLAIVGAELFNEKKYAASILPLQQYLAVKTDDQFILALAIAQIETGKLEEAYIELNKLIDKKSVFANEASWYTILLELKRSNKQKALEAIERLPAGSRHSADAAEIKTQLLRD